MRRLVPGDLIECKGTKAWVIRIVSQQVYKNFSGDGKDYYVEFTDHCGKYRFWKSSEDGGKAIFRKPIYEETGVEEFESRWGILGNYSEGNGFRVPVSKVSTCESVSTGVLNLISCNYILVKEKSDYVLLHRYKDLDRLVLVEMIDRAPEIESVLKEIGMNGYHTAFRLDDYSCNESISKAVDSIISIGDGRVGFGLVLDWDRKNTNKLMFYLVKYSRRL